MVSNVEIELQGIVREYEAAQKQSEHNDCSDVISDVKVKQLQTRCLAAIARATGRTSVYYEQAVEITKEIGNPYRFLAGQIGVVQSLLQAIQEGHIQPGELSPSKVNTSPENQQVLQSQNSRKVFVVHGRNLVARDAMFTFLQSINLEPIEWSEAVKMTGAGSPYIGEVLEKAFAQVQAVVVLFTGDDLAKLDDRLLDKGESPEISQPQARANVLFEAGMAVGLHPKRTVLVQLGKLRTFSDIAGRHVVSMDDSVATRSALAERLKTAGCAVKTDGRSHWHKAGQFDSAILVQENGTDKSQQPNTERHLSKIKEKILLVLANQKEFISTEQLAGAIAANPQVVLFNLAELKKSEMVYDILSLGSPTRWKLHHEGRRYLIDNELIGQ